MRVRVVHVRFTQTAYAQIRKAAKQTKLPVSFFLKEVIQSDLATRRLQTSPLVVGPSTKMPRKGSAPQLRTYQVHLPGNHRLFGL